MMHASLLLCLNIALGSSFFIPPVLVPEYGRTRAAAFSSSSCLHSTGSSSSADEEFTRRPAQQDNNELAYNPAEHIEEELLNDSMLRQERLEQESANSKRFVRGQALVDLRQRVAMLKEKRDFARATSDAEDVKRLDQKIEAEEYRDADLVYKRAREAGDIEEAENARPFVPHLNLHGLWVGKYGSSGYEMINVTYIEDDYLLATKVTGDKNVPAGELTFTAKLGHGEEPLSPIDLSESAAKKWGISRLTRYSGRGQVAAEGFKDAQWLEGQLIMVGEYFSFAWVPLGTQIFFGRPSLALMTKMLKEKYGMDDTRTHLSRCFDGDEEEEMESCILDFDDEGAFQ